MGIAKGGGLADISSSLFGELLNQDFLELFLFLPKYNKNLKNITGLTDKETDLLKRDFAQKNIYFIEDSAFSSLDVYQENNIHSMINKSLAFSRYIVNVYLDKIKPDIVHTNDVWTSLINVAAKAKGYKSLFTLHNFFTAYETLENIEKSGLVVDRMAEYFYYSSYPTGNPLHNKKQSVVDFTTSGIFSADFINMVSPGILEECINGSNPNLNNIITSAMLHEIKEKYYAGYAKGILNSPNPDTNYQLVKKAYNLKSETIDKGGAEEAKKLFQEMMGLEVNPQRPLFVFPNRVTWQKGIHLVRDYLDHHIQKTNAQYAIVANGESIYTNEYQRLAHLNPKQIVYQKYDENLSLLAKTASDFTSMPSLYEPCGIPQMEAPIEFRSMTVARKTGGLKNTVFDLSADRKTGNGFTFEHADIGGFLYAMNNAINFYNNTPKEKQKIILDRIQRESRQQFSITNTGKEYANIYKKIAGW